MSDRDGDAAGSGTKKIVNARLRRERDRVRRKSHTRSFSKARHADVSTWARPMGVGGQREARALERVSPASEDQRVTS